MLDHSAIPNHATVKERPAEGPLHRLPGVQHHPDRDFTGEAEAVFPESFPAPAERTTAQGKQGAGPAERPAHVRPLEALADNDLAANFHYA